jgi:hypothetical protein
VTTVAVEEAEASDGERDATDIRVNLGVGGDGDDG